uniref:Uncharacterized protein n=1 Tax=Physcomitrium patens TaxID=3218 RepID=A0A2K1KFL4_PHYPA|nr:hypothetical protein PHYPA_008948 [Physcomitrium patens]
MVRLANAFFSIHDLSMVPCRNDAIEFSDMCFTEGFSVAFLGCCQARFRGVWVWVTDYHSRSVLSLNANSEGCSRDGSFVSEADDIGSRG